MSASVQTLPVLSGGPEGLAGAADNLSVNQVDSGSGESFGPVLGEAFAALSESGEGDFELPLGGDPLTDLLQTLPEGGKLLPLLEQAMNEAVAAGIDPQEVVDRITDGLEALQLEPELNPAQQLAGVIRQVIQELPAMKSAQTAAAALPALDADASSALQQQRSAPHITVKDVSVGGQAGDISVEFERAVQRIEQVPVQRMEQNEAKTLKLAGLEQAFERLQQPGGESRQADLASMMVAFKRLAADRRGAVSEVLPRADGVAAVAAPAAAAGSSTAAVTLPPVTLNAPLGQAGWDQALGERIQWMVNQKMQGAEVRLNPAHLGPMEVRIQVQNDQASVYFSAQHGAVREALEAALPRLRDMFEASGVELVDVDVSDQSFAEQRAMQEDAEGERSAGVSQETEADGDIHVESSLGGFLKQGVLDLFA